MSWLLYANVAYPVQARLQVSLHECVYFAVDQLVAYIDMYTKLNASRSYVYAVARACDRGQISRRVGKIGSRASKIHG